MSEENKQKKEIRDLLSGGGDKKNPRKGPKFSIYWIYAVVAVTLIGYNIFGNISPDAFKTTEMEFKSVMLLNGDVAKMDVIQNKLIVRVYVKPESLNKEFYKKKYKGTVPAKSKGPHFEFSVTDWASGGIFNIGKSKATLFEKGTKVNITFADVAGLDEAKVEVMEIVDFLKNPKNILH
jgi:AFG3 family protein